MEYVPQRVGSQDNVGVQQQDVAPGCQLQADIVGDGETGVRRVADEMNLWEALLDTFRCAVVRIVVHDDDFDCQIAAVLEDTVQAVVNVVTGIVGDDYDREVGHDATP